MNESSPSGPGKRTSRLAIASLILGLLPIVFLVSTSFETSPRERSILTVGFILFLSPLAAIILGHIARSRIKRSMGAMAGSAWAVGGLVLSYGWLILVVVEVVPNIQLQDGSAMRRNSCVANLKQIDGAIQQWALDNKKTPLDKVTTNDVLGYFRSNVLPECPAGGTYGMTVVSNSPTCTIPGHTL